MKRARSRMPDSFSPRGGSPRAGSAGARGLFRTPPIAAALLAAFLALPAHAQREPAAPGGSGLRSNWSGWVQFDTAYAWHQPAHFANARNRGEVAGRGEWGNGVKWKVSARGSYDFAYGQSDHYPPDVRADQRGEVALHEAYVDFSRGDWEFRLGKQNIVWGEMVGLFFADVVSAKDLRALILPEFDQIRIPQWAARAEWFKGDTHLELVWLPTPAVDRIGMPGAEFYPYPIAYPGFGYQILPAQTPSRNLSNSGFGVRLSTLVDGWDMAAFVYRAPDTGEAFYRSVAQGPLPTVSYQARYDIVTRLGATVAKDFDGLVAKAEMVFSDGRQFSLTTLGAGTGLVPLRTLDWVVGLDATPWDDWRINVQLFQRAFVDYDPRIGMKRHESGASLLVVKTLQEGLDAEFLGITSLDRSDWLLRATMVWKLGSNTRVRLGVDSLGGEPIGMFGRYGSRDRVWGEYRYSF